MPDLRVFRNDECTVAEILALRPGAILLSPGPCDPNKAGICLALTKEAAAAQIPLLGICLGHQTIAQAFGGEVVRHSEIVHGKMGTIHHDGSGVFQGLPKTFEATRYHSLVVAPESLPQALEVTAKLDDGTIMGLAHRAHPIHGLQFHPESIASEYGREILKNFLELAEGTDEHGL